MLVPFETMDHGREAEDVLEFGSPYKQVIDRLSGFRFLRYSLLGGGVSRHGGGSDLSQ